jgi:hypothetical protein
MFRSKLKIQPQIMSLSLDVVAADLSALRPGIRYEITGIDDTRKGGCFNTHFPITFEDGVKWMLRVRKVGQGDDIISPDDYWFGVEREVTTLQAMFRSGIRTVSDAYLPPTRTSVTPGRSDFCFARCSSTRSFHF